MIAVLAMLAGATASATPAVDPAKLTAQQLFDTATSDSQLGKCREAITLFDAAERRSQAKPGSLSGAMIDVRRGQCLIATGQISKGTDQIRAGLPVLRQQADTFKVDIANGLLGLGDAAMRHWAYDDARRAYLEALAIPGGASPIRVYSALAQASAFDGGPEPLQYARKAIDLAQAKPDFPKKQLADLHAIHANILMNQGQIKQAYAELKSALDQRGGLSLRASLDDAALRGDLALAAKLSGDDEAARRYLAYTGAGRIEHTPFESAVTMAPPLCGAQTGLRPSDFAVVQFAIDKQGRVIGAQTVYTPGSAKVAAAFAQAVSDWAWTPADAAKIPAFYRFSTRVEVRCTTSDAEAPSLYTPMGQRFRQWADAQLQLTNISAPKAGETNWAVVKELKARLAQAKTAHDEPHQIAALGMLALYAPLDRLSLNDRLEQALSLSQVPSVPAQVRNWLKTTQWAYRRGNSPIKGLHRATPDEALALLATPEMTDDALASDTLKIMTAKLEHDPLPVPEQRKLLTQVTQDSRLAPGQPLKQIAYLSLANLAADEKDYAAAQAYFAKTGLSDEQCALLGMTPAMRHSNVSSNDFPTPALAYGFEGWVTLEFNVGANGHTSSVRPIIAYPPFIFSHAAADSAGDFRYESSYRPAGGLACSAQQAKLSYRIS